MVVTGPTVIMPLLRCAWRRPRVASLLKWEGIVNDPIGALLAALVFEYLIVAPHTESFGETLGTMRAAVTVVTVMLFVVRPASVWLSINGLGRFLGLADAGEPGMLIIGASAWSTDLAQALTPMGQAVTVGDGNRHHLRKLRLAGTPTFYGDARRSARSIPQLCLRQRRHPPAG